MNSNNKLVYYKCVYRCKLCGATFDVSLESKENLDIDSCQDVHYITEIGRKLSQKAKSHQISDVFHACEFNKEDVPTQIGTCEFIGFQLKD